MLRLSGQRIPVASMRSPGDVIIAASGAGPQCGRTEAESVASRSSCDRRNVVKVRCRLWCCLHRLLPLGTPDLCERPLQVRVETRGVAKRGIENRLHVASRISVVQPKPAHKFSLTSCFEGCNGRLSARVDTVGAVSHMRAVGPRLSVYSRPTAAFRDRCSHRLPRGLERFGSEARARR